MSYYWTPSVIETLRVAAGRFQDSVSPGNGAAGLRGRPLRYLLVTLLADAGAPMTVRELISGCGEEGVTFSGRASKILSDALRWEVRNGRVRRLARGVYTLGHVPGSTRRWIAHRVAQTRCWLRWVQSHQSNRWEGGGWPEVRQWQEPSTRWGPDDGALTGGLGRRGLADGPCGSDLAAPDDHWKLSDDWEWWRWRKVSWVPGWPRWPVPSPPSVALTEGVLGSW